ncbi:MAG: hypothetical protein FWC13_11715 [Oscillospiraceae bacterium]|nr:hypothetical protein [Oscillospiraceae bacterium]
MDIKVVRRNFYEYLQSRYPDNSNNHSTASMAFYSTRHEFGVDFTQIINTRTIPIDYKEKIEAHFRTINRKNPRNDASTYENALQLLYALPTALRQCTIPKEYQS